MVADIRIEGADAVARVAKHLKEIGDKALQKELTKALKDAGRDLPKVAQHAAEANLPKRGGLNEFVASSRFRITARAGTNPRVRLVGSKRGHDIKSMDRGKVRHPVYGNRSNWVLQSIAPGWFSNHIAEDALDRAREQMAQMLQVIARKATGG